MINNGSNPDSGTQPGAGTSPTDRPAAFSVDEFVNRWLSRVPPSSNYTKFKHIPIAEQVDQRNRVLGCLAEVVFIHHNDPLEFKEYVAALGYEQAAEVFDKRPKDDKTRKANFGEIVACEYLRQAEGYDLPVYRLRWNTNPDTSMRGEDALAFKFGNSEGIGREMCVAEAKVAGGFSSDTVGEGYNQLSKGKRPRPNSIPFICSVLRLKGELDKAKAIVQFLNRLNPHPPKRTNFLLVITGNKPRDPFAVIQGLPQVIDNLVAADLSITELDNLVDSVFDVQVAI